MAFTVSFTLSRVSELEGLSQTARSSTAGYSVIRFSDCLMNFSNSYFFIIAPAVSLFSIDVSESDKRELSLFFAFSHSE
ncbi:MAG: hypothetical protein BWY84_00873 [Candidatus Aerophobetes bacterium ADurb.Bin490]|nr:MAG: hypothetical protein BWY84_00873 [Candidatus Aerophobetes bacterium ADurb.Bin490]